MSEQAQDHEFHARDSLSNEIARQMGMMPTESVEDEDDQIESVMQMATRMNTPVPERKSDEKPFEFDPEFQTKVAALFVRDETFCRRVDGLLKPEYFESRAEAALVHIAAMYHGRYRRLPDVSDWKELLKDARSEKVLRDDDMPDVVAALKTICKVPLSGREYAVDKVATFAKNQAVSLAMVESIMLVQSGQIEKAEAMMKKAFSTGAKSAVEASSYWNSIEERTQYRRDIEAGLIKPNGVTTGIPKLDKILYHQGWGRKELSVIMGGAKKGKSTGLLSFAVNASKAGKNVFYATLEVSRQIIMDRMDANVSGVDMAELSTRNNEVSRNVKDQAAIRRPGVLEVAEWASGTLTCTELKRALEFYKAQNITFDLIVVDYADIMAPEIKTGNDINDSKQVWLGLRAIAHEENAALLTATQTNRDGFKADVAKAEHAAEDFNKIRIADLVLSINRTDDEKAKGEARLFFAASRNQAGEFTLKISQELGKMRFMTGILDIT